MTHSDKSKPTFQRPVLKIVASSSTEEAANPQEDPSSSSASTTSSPSTEDTSFDTASSKRTKAERDHFLSEVEEYIDMILEAANNNQITGIAFVTINEDHQTSGTAYTQSCENASHLTLAAIETLKYRYLRDFMAND